MSTNKRNLKIAIEAQRIFRPRKHGMDVVALEMIKSLQQFDTENEYSILIHKDSDICLSETKNFKIIFLESSFYPYWEQWSLKQWVKKNKPHILHCTSNTAPLNVSAKLFLTLHDIIFLEKNYFLSRNGGSPYQRFGNFYRNIIVPYVAQKAESIFTVSNYQKERIIEKLRIPETKIDVVYNGVSDVFFKLISTGQKSVIQAKYNLPDKYIFFLGNTEPRKNLVGVIKAYKILYNELSGALPVLVIKGITTSYLNKTCTDLAADQIIQNIVLIQYIDKYDFPAIYQMAEMLLFPSFSEGFGIPIIESMASGTPVITSNTTSMPEVAGNAALLINPYKTDELVNAIKKLLSDKSLRNDLSVKGIERAKQFTWSRMAEIIHQKYLNVNLK